jgi:hypothetical protein
MGILAGIASCTAPCTYPPTQRAGQTHEEAELLRRLRVAECIDRMTAAAWTKNPALEQYYDEKAEDLHNIIVRLENAEPPSQQEISEALDTSKATQWSGFSY